MPRLVSDEWKADCLRERGRILTGEMSHWCYDWDFLPVDETTPEAACCTCIVTWGNMVYKIATH